MIKLLLGRLLPLAAVGWFMTSALSPLKGTLRAFGIAANALAGDTDAGGVDLTGDSGPARVATSDEKNRLLRLADQVSEGQTPSDDFRGLRPVQLPGSSKPQHARKPKRAEADPP